MFGTKFTAKEVTVITAIGAGIYAIGEGIKYLVTSRKTKNETTQAEENTKTDKKVVNH